jgi:hypothetical protein
MAEREANAAIYVSRSQDGLAHELGEWSEGASTGGRWVACTNEHLITAIRFLVVQERLGRLKAFAPTVDASSIQTHVQRIRTALTRVKNVNAKATEIRDCSDAIRSEVEQIRDDVRSALDDIEESLGSMATAEAGEAA